MGAHLSETVALTQEARSKELTDHKHCRRAQLRLSRSLKTASRNVDGQKQNPIILANSLTLHVFRTFAVTTAALQYLTALIYLQANREI